MQNKRAGQRWLRGFSDSGPRLVRDLFSLVSSQLFSLLLGFLSFSYLARILDSASYGALEYAIGIAAFVGYVIDSGMGSIGTRGVAQERGKADSLAASILSARLLLALVILPLVGLSSYLTGQDGRTTALVWLFALGLLALPWRQVWLFQGLEKMNHAAVGMALRTVAFAAGVFLLVHGSRDLLLLGFIQIASEAICLIYFIAIQHVLAIPFRLELRISVIWAVIREGFSVGMSQIVVSFSQYAPLFLVANLIGGSETARFAAPLRILIALLGVTILYHYNLFPTIARQLTQDRQEWSRLMRTSVRVVAWSSVGIALILTLISEPLMLFVFGKGFAASVSVFSILIWVLPVRLIADHARWTLVASDSQRYLLLAEVIGAITLVATGLILIPAFGSIGAAACAVISNLLSWVSVHFFAVRLVGRLPSFYVPCIPMFVAVACIALTSFVKLGIFLAAGVTILGYAICASLIGGDLRAEIKRLAYAKNPRQTNP